MNRRQFGYLAGFLFAWLGWAASFWVALGAVVIGLIGYGAARLLEGDLDLGDLSELIRPQQPQVTAKRKEHLMSESSTGAPSAETTATSRTVPSTPSGGSSHRSGRPP